MYFLDDSVSSFAAVFLAGSGLLFAGIGNLAAHRYGRFQIAATLASFGLVLLGVDALSSDRRLLLPTALFLLLGYVPFAVCGRLSSARVARSPARWIGLALLGLATSVGSAIIFHFEDTADIDRQMSELDRITFKPPMQQATSFSATTDRGTVIPLMEPIAPGTPDELAERDRRTIRQQLTGHQLIRQERADDRSNCHGWVFTGGRFALLPESVDVILRENGYAPVSEPRVGDLTIYGPEGARTHTAIVRYVSPGMPTMVEGKWGSGPVFLHAFDQYGENCTYYRSPRSGHLLGLDAADQPTVLSSNPDENTE